MRKFQIFLFIEACLLTGALIMMVSEHFSRFLLILLLFLLLIRYYTGKQGNKLYFSGGEHPIFLYHHAQSLCHHGYLCGFDLQSVLTLSYDEPRKRRYQSDF